jgi:hypothetical protein
MVYDKPLELNDLIVYAWVEILSDYVESINGKDVPYMYRASFYLLDNKKAWRAELQITVENEVPRLDQVTTTGAGEIPLWVLNEIATGKATGATWKNKTLDDYESVFSPVQVKYLKQVAQFSFELTQKATVLAIANIAKKKSKYYTSKELQLLEKELSKNSRRNTPTEAMLKDVAKRYIKAEKAGEPVYHDIMRHYEIGERRARELATMCRRSDRKYLPKRQAGKPSVKKATTRKKGK